MILQNKCVRIKHICYIITVAVNSAKKRKFDVSAFLIRGGGNMTKYEIVILILAMISTLFTILSYFK